MRDYKAPWVRKFTVEPEPMKVSTTIIYIVLFFIFAVWCVHLFIEALILEEQQAMDMRLIAAERRIDVYLPIMRCDSCHNLRIGATKEPKK
jgi:hypothetical protein